MIYIVAAVFFAIAGFAILCLRRIPLRNFLLPQEPPGPRGWPVLGNLPLLDKRAPHRTLQQLSQRYGQIFSLRLGSVRTVVLADAGWVRECFRRPEFTARAPLYVTHGIMGGWGLICAEGALWKDQRRHTIDWLKHLGMTKRSGEMRSSLEQRIRQGVDECLMWLRDDSEKLLEVDPLPAMQHTLGNIINRLVFGVAYARDDVTWRYLQDLQEEGLKLIGVSGVVNFMPWLRFLPSQRRNIDFLLDGKQKSHQLYDAIIERTWEKVQHFEDPEQCSSILEHFLMERQAVSGQRLPEDRARLPFYQPAQLRHLLADLYGAGVDTTLTTLRWLVLYLAKWPKVQEKLHASLCQAIPSQRASEFGLEDLMAVPYLRACVAEAQRIRSVVPLGIPHGVVEDTEIFGRLIRKGSMVLPLQWAIHMNPEDWPEPEEFRPERFLNGDGQYEQPAQFIPFQTGKRMCPGDEMARMILHLYAGCLFRHYRVQLAPGYDDVDMAGETGFTLAPPHYKITLEACP